LIFSLQKSLKWGEGGGGERTPSGTEIDGKIGGGVEDVEIKREDSGSYFWTEAKEVEKKKKNNEEKRE